LETKRQLDVVGPAFWADNEYMAVRVFPIADIGDLACMVSWFWGRLYDAAEFPERRLVMKPDEMGPKKIDCAVPR